MFKVARGELMAGKEEFTGIPIKEEPVNIDESSKFKSVNATNSDTIKSKIPKSIALAAKKSSKITMKKVNTISSSNETTESANKHSKLEQDQRATKSTSNVSTVKSVAKGKSQP